MSNEQKKRSSKKLCLYIQNGGDDIQKWLNLSTFWKILALGVTFAVLIFAVESAVVYVVCMHVYYNNISSKIITDVDCR